MMAFARWARLSAASAKPLCSAFTSHGAGYKSLVPSFGLREFNKDDLKGLLSQRDILLQLHNNVPYICQKQCFGRLIAPPPHLQRQGGLKIYQGSPGILIDPYHVPARSPFFTRWLTRKGWREIKESFIRQLRSGYALAKLRQKTGKFARKLFYADVQRMYREINTAIAAGDRNALKPFVTENMLSTLKNEIKRRDGVWEKVEWRLDGPMTVSTLQARMAATDPKDLDKAFVQITVKIKSNQYFAAYDCHDKVVAGEPSKQISVEDIWVFETFFGAPERKFRLCGRIVLQ